MALCKNQRKMSAYKPNLYSENVFVVLKITFSAFSDKESSYFLRNF